MSGRVRFGKYELVARLAKGGMGETFRAELVADAGVVKPVVIKKMLPYLTAEAGLVEAFIQEARLSATLTHSNLAQVFDFGEVDGEYFIAMEYVDGRSLEAVLGRAKELGWPRLPFQLSVFIVTELLKGLSYAQTRSGADGRPLNLVHRDISPDNVLLGFEGEVKLVDFGVAKTTMAGRAETEPGLVKGKFRYLSPEQAVAKPLDARSDLFTVGVMLYQLVTGEAPFSGQQHTVMQAIVSGDYVTPRVRCGDVPEPIAEVIERAMQPSREQRFGSAQEMLEPLARWLFGQSPDFSGVVLRELLGQLFDGDLLRDGRLFVSQPTARAKLAGLVPGRDVPAPTQVVSALQPATQPSGPSLEGETKASASAVVPAASSASVPALKRGPPIALLGLAGALTLGAVGVIGFEVANANRPEGLAASEMKALGAPPGGMQVAKQAAPEGPLTAAGAGPVVEATPEVTFDAETAPVSFKLSTAHQVVVPRTNCVDLGKKWRLQRGDALRVSSVTPRATGPGSNGKLKMDWTNAGYNGGRNLQLFALFQGVRGPAQVWSVAGEISGADEGKVCAFGLTDRSLEQQLHGVNASVHINGVERTLVRPLVNVEPDDRYQVRSFPAGKTWVVKVHDLSPPWPVLFVTDSANQTKPIVLDQRETVLKWPKSVWLTVPVLEPQADYSRAVAISLAAGEKLKESAADLLATSRKAYDLKHWGEAARTLDQCINAYPTYPACHMLLGATFAQLGYSEDAKTQYLEYLKLASPKDPERATVQKVVDEYEKKLGAR
ncbi:MAG: serine/threonine protein kinase [Myxococcaceae bacterium]|nr:serine/threonine protein kinase [Myxococcaceae bacterium]